MSFVAFQAVVFDPEKGTIYHQDILTATNAERARDKVVHDLEDDVNLDTVSVVISPLVGTKAAY